MEIKLTDIILFVIIAGAFVALVWELIPEGTKKHWQYSSDIRRDRRRGERKRYAFSWRGEKR